MRTRSIGFLNVDESVMATATCSAIRGAGAHGDEMRSAEAVQTMAKLLHFGLAVDAVHFEKRGTLTKGVVVRAQLALHFLVGTVRGRRDVMSLDTRSKF